MFGIVVKILKVRDLFVKIGKADGERIHARMDFHQLFSNGIDVIPGESHKKPPFPLYGTTGEKEGQDKEKE